MRIVELWSPSFSVYSVYSVVEKICVGGFADVIHGLLQTFLSFAKSLQYNALITVSIQQQRWKCLGIMELWNYGIVEPLIFCVFSVFRG